MIKCVVQDTLGFIWVGTDFGVVRFDGQKSIRIIQYFQPYVKSLLLTKSKKILVTLDNGIGEIQSYPDTTTVKYIITNRSIENFRTNFPKSAIEEDNGTIWFAESQSICKIQNRKLKRYEFQSKDFAQSMTVSYSMLIDSFGIFWVVSNPGYLYYFDPIQDKFVEVVLKCSPMVATNQILSPIAGELWIASFSGIYKLKITKDKELTEQTFIPVDGIATCLVGNYKDGIMCGTMANGLFQVDYSDIRKIKLKKVEAINSGQINQIYQGKNKDWWICTNDGLVLLQKTFFNTPKFADNQSSNPNTKMIQSISQSGNGILYFADGLNVYQLNKKKDWIATPLFDSLYYYVTPYRTIADNDYLWIGSGDTRNFLYNFKNKTMSEIKNANQGLFITSMERDSAGNIWNTQNRQMENVIKVFPMLEIFQLPMYSYSPIIKKDKQGNLFSAGATAMGFYLFKYDFKANKFENISHRTNYNIFVNDICFDNSGAIWLGAEQGLFKHTADTLVKIELDGIYKNEPITSIAYSDDGSVWFANIYGIVRYKNNYSVLYNKFNGLAANTIQPRNLFVDDENYLWVGTAKGASYAKITSETGQKTPVPLILTCKVNGDKICLTASKSFEFPYHSYFEIEFSSLVYPTSENIYQIKLIGKDDKWSESTSKPNLFLPNLESGDYSLQIKTQKFGENYQWSDPLIFKFTVLQAWYKTWWAILLFILSFALVVWIIVKLYSRKLIKEKEQLEEIVKIRTEQVVKQKDEILENNVMLQQQKEEITAQRDEIEAQRDEIQKQNTIVTGQNKKITDSIRYASRIQAAVLPPFELINESLPEHFIFYKPKDIVSGDFYWFKAFNNMIALAAADCTGHGVPGAIMSMLGISFLNEITAKFTKMDIHQIIRPDFILNELREYIKASLRQTGKDNETKDGMDIALAIIDKINFKLYFAGANNPLFIVRSKVINSETELAKELIELKADKMPIGIHLREKDSFSGQEIDLQKNDMIYLFSDGYEDQFGGNGGRKFLSRNFKNLLLSISHHQPFRQQEILNNTINEWIGNREQVDDIMVIGIRMI
jgi:ligand-binding sensor domain-containing protein/serine phosphatase RsbU (regulator of sigma subunit)